MNRQQWKAVFDFCKENFYSSPSSLLKQLKMYNVVPQETNIEELAEFANGNTYQDMYTYLERCMWER